MNSFDYTKQELDYINENARFNNRQQKIFDSLTSLSGRQKIYTIAMEMNLSERTVCREIQNIKNKINKLHK